MYTMTLHNGRMQCKQATFVVFNMQSQQAVHVFGYDGHGFEPHQIIFSMFSLNISLEDSDGLSPEGWQKR